MIDRILQLGLHRVEQHWRHRQWAATSAPSAAVFTDARDVIPRPRPRRGCHSGKKARDSRPLFTNINYTSRSADRSAQLILTIVTQTRRSAGGRLRFYHGQRDQRPAGGRTLRAATS